MTYKSNKSCYGVKNIYCWDQVLNAGGASPHVVQLLITKKWKNKKKWLGEMVYCTEANLARLLNVLWWQRQNSSLDQSWDLVSLALTYSLELAEEDVGLQHEFCPSVGHDVREMWSLLPVFSDM